MHQIKLTTPSGNTEIIVGEKLSSGLTSMGQSPVLLVDEHVLCEHQDLFSCFQNIAIPSGERYKNMQTVESIYRELVNMEVDRSSLIVGVGGGLATDVAGFVASTYLRGIPFGFISSTLLGQVDASIGGKNGVNLDGYKNMIGNFTQPSFVWCDLTLLHTLARREYIAGIAEVIKYGAIWDEDFLNYLTDHMTDLLDLDLAALEHVVSLSAQIKVDVVQKDERESNLRRILNFGHTIGHAIEREKKVLHGQAVAVGMVMAARLSYNMGLLPASDVDILQNLIKSAGLPYEMDLDPEIIFQNIRKDKKKSGEDIHVVLLDSIGKTLVKTISLSELKPMIDDLC